MPWSDLIWTKAFDQERNALWQQFVSTVFPKMFFPHSWKIHIQYYLFWLQLKAVFLNLGYFHLDMAASEHFQVNRLLIKYWKYMKMSDTFYLFDYFHIIPVAIEYQEIHPCIIQLKYIKHIGSLDDRRINQLSTSFGRRQIWGMIINRMHFSVCEKCGSSSLIPNWPSVNKCLVLMWQHGHLTIWL